MRVIAYDDILEYAARVMPWIEREPVRHNLIATLVAGRVADSRPGGHEVVLWAVVDDGDRIAGLAVKTPPLPMLVVTEMPPAAHQAVAAAAKIQGLQGFNGPNTRHLAELAAGDKPIRLRGASGLHRLRRVVPPEDVPGHPRLAEPDDLYTIFPWVLGFQTDVGDEEPLREPQVRARIADGGVWGWEHGGQLVSMAAWTKPVHGVVRINLVYTPPHHRGHGYASALVAAVSQTILDEGHIPILYTDLANPTTNKIYAAVGFERLEEPEFWEIHHEVRGATVEAVNNLAERWASRADPEESTVFSAASVWPLLALLADAAGGAARDELLAAVGPVEDPRAAALELLGALDAVPQVRAALGVWVRAGLPLTETWSDAAVLTDQAALDEWVRRRTGGLIERLPISVGRDTLLVLANALTVRTPWRRPFDEGLGGKLFRSGTDFDCVSVIDGLTRVRVEGTGPIDVHLLVGSSESVVAQGISSIGQPGTSGSQLLATGGTGPGISHVSVRDYDAEPQLHLSTRAFAVEAGHDLLLGDNAALFGLAAASDTSRGHFPGISSLPLAVSAARQDAMAAFNSHGFEAAAVTAFGAVAAGIPPHRKQVLRVEVQPPFGFLAVHRPSGLVLVAGWIAR